MQKLKRRHTNENGVALVWVILLFMILMILVPSALFLARQDTLETVNEENRIKAYYVALSGIDIGYAALMTDVSGEPYIQSFVSDSSLSVESTIAVPSAGSAKITIDNVLVDGYRWIRITSLGSLTGNSATATSVMRIRTDNYSFIMRESN